MLRKKWLSLLVACAMVAAMMPTAAFAETDPNAATNPSSAVGQATGETAEGGDEQSGETEKPQETEQSKKVSTETKEVRTPSNGAMLLDNETAQDGMIEVGGQTYSFEEGLTHIADGSEVKLLGNVTLTSTLKITANNVTFNLNGFTISGNFEGNLVDLTNGATKVTGVKIMNGKLAGGTKHTLNVWNATGVTLENLELDNSTTTGGAPLIVGSSDVTLAGTITVDEGTNSWYAINVDCRNVNGDSVPASLTVGAEIVFKGAVDGKTGICVDNVHGTDPSAVKVSFADGAKFTDKEDGAKAGAIIALNSTNVDGMHGATIEHWIGYDVVPGAAARIGNAYYTSFDAAYDAAKEGDTVELCGDLELDSKLVLDEDGVSLDLNGNTITASTNYTTSDGQPHLVEVTADDVTIKGGELKATNAIKHTLNVYQAKNVTLDGLTLDNEASQGGAPLIVNASDVTLKGNMNFVTGEKSWYSVNVDSKGTSATLTVDPAAAVTFKAAEGTTNKQGISISNGTGVTVTIEDGATVTGTDQLVVLNSKEDESGAGATIVGLDNIGVDVAQMGAVVSVGDQYFDTLEDAVAAASAGDTITLGVGEFTLDQPIVLNKQLTIQGSGAGTVVNCVYTQTYGNGPFTFTGGSEGSVLKDMTIKYNNAANQQATVYFDGGFTGGSPEKTTKIQNINFVSDGTAIAVSSTYVNGGYVDISGCTIDNFKYGMYFNGIHHLTISGNTIKNTQYNAINIAGDNKDIGCNNISIVGNTLTGISSANYPDDKYSSGIRIGLNATGITLQNNSVSMQYGKKGVYFDPTPAGEAASHYIITFMSDGAEVSKYVVGDSFTLPAAPAKSGYTFLGWSDGTNTYNAGTQIKVSADVTFTAQWKQIETPSTSTSSSSSTTTSQSGTTIPYYTCPACGYHDWTATADGYKCDNCGYIESVKQLSGYGNVKGIYEPKTSTAAAQTASGTTATSAIPQTSDESNPMLWAFLLMISGGALASLAVFKKKKEN